MAPISLPPGFRFHPTDEELVAYYLKGKVHGWKIELDIIPEVDIYKCEPWDLPEKSFLPGSDLEYYFFSARDKKYPHGSRTNRATKAGYWKATGKDRKVSSHMRPIGMKKTLVFYTGRAPHGSRTAWVMHEYRLDEKECEASASLQDASVLCRVFKKSGPAQKIGVQYGTIVGNDFSCGLDNSTQYNTFEELSREMSSPLSHGEEDDLNYSRETYSELINGTKVDDGVSKRKFQSVSYDNAVCSFPSLNESINHPKVEYNETSCSPLEVGVFPPKKNCLSLSDLTILCADLLHEHVHSSVNEADLLEQIYRDAQTAQENNYISQFINSDVADIHKNEDYLQVDDFAPGLNIENNHKQPSISDEDEEEELEDQDEELDLFSLNSFVSEYYNSESFHDQPEQLLFFNPFLRQNSNPENLACMLT